MLNILVIDDELVTCHYFHTILKKNGYTVNTCHTGIKALSIIQNSSLDVIFLDLNLPDIHGKQLLQEIKKSNPDIPVFIVTASHDIKTAVEMMKSGAESFITKPFIDKDILEELENVIAKKRETEIHCGYDDEITLHSISSEAEKFKLSTINKTYVIGKNRSAIQMQKRIELVAPTDYSVIIYGESGTGKEMVATAIHEFSKRKEKPFIAVDCGVLTTDLAKSELYGHEKGAFTGADKLKKGFFEQADGGTLFLDEINNLTLEIQASLLRALQERKLRRMGSSREISFDVRLIVASNVQLSKSVINRTFREDLFHRINEFSLELSPLRNQKDDIIIYAVHFLQQINKEMQKSIPGFKKEVIQAFQSYSWPGNLRELNNVIKRASIFTDSDPIASEHLPDDFKNYAVSQRGSQNPYLTNSETNDLKEVAIRAERKKIISVIKSVNYNKTKAAKILNIDRKTLYNKLKDYNINL